MRKEAANHIDYAAPPRPLNASGKPRGVGLEVEFANITLPEALEVVASTLGGTVHEMSKTQGTVEGTRFGQFKVELDSTPLKERRYLRPLEALGVEDDSATARMVEDSVLRIAREFVPLEIVTPPIPWHRLHELDSVWHALRERGAEDTRSSVFYAFGLHLNPELPDLKIETVVPLVRSYFLLEEWIIQESRIDATRRIAPYIHPFPEEYRRLVIDPRYAPNWQSFMDDYVEHNPTRNRPLDILPLIAEACPVDLTEKIDTWGKVKARPTFHYRLPNCELTSPNWSPAIDWNRWVMVEQLSENRALCEELALAYLKACDLPLSLQGANWLEHLKTRFPIVGTDDAAFAS